MAKQSKVTISLPCLEPVVLRDCLPPDTIESPSLLASDLLDAACHVSHALLVVPAVSSVPVVLAVFCVLVVLNECSLLLVVTASTVPVLLTVSCVLVVLAVSPVLAVLIVSPILAVSPNLVVSQVSAVVVSPALVGSAAVHSPAVPALSPVVVSSSLLSPVPVSSPPGDVCPLCVH